MIGSERAVINGLSVTIKLQIPFSKKGQKHIEIDGRFVSEKSEVKLNQACL